MKTIPLTLLRICLLLFTATALLSAEAIDTSPKIDIHVKGLVCDFCARSVEKTFGKIKSIDSIKVDLDAGFIRLKLKEGKTLSDEKIAKLIKANGYSLESIKRYK